MRQIRKRLAAILTGVAVLGLVVTPVAHSELHFREAQVERESALAIVFHLGFLHRRTLAQEQALRHAISHAFGDGEQEPGFTAPEEDESHPHHHTHGGNGVHGAGSLQHGSVALQCAQQPLELFTKPAQGLVTIAGPPSPLRSPRYSIPRNSQAPPTA